MDKNKLFNRFLDEEYAIGRNERGILNLKRKLPMFFRFLKEHAS